MATEEKKYLVNIESNLDKYAEEANKAAEEVARLTVQNKALQDSGKASGEEIEKSNAQLRAAKGEYADAKKMLDLQTKANMANTESRKQMGLILALEQRRLGNLADQYTINAQGQRVLSEEYLEQVKRVKDAKDAIIEYDKAQNDGRSSVGLYSEAIDKSLKGMSFMPPVVGQATTAVKTFGASMKALLLNPIVAFLAAIVAGVMAVMQYFKRSEEGQNKFAKMMSVISSVIENLLDVIGNLGGKLVKAFEDPKQAVADLWEAIKKNIVNRFVGVVEMFKAGWELISKGAAGVGLAIKGIFNEEAREESKQYFAEAGKAAYDFGNAAVKTATGIDDAFGKAREGMKSLAQELSNDAKIAKRLADERANLAKMERRYLVENAKLSSEYSRLLAEAEEVKRKDAKASISLIKEAYDIQEEILARELEVAQIKARNAAQQAELSQSNIETLDEIARLEADVEAKRKIYEDKRRERELKLREVRMEGIRQEQVRRTAQLQIWQTEEAANIKMNENIVANTRSSLAEKEQAINENLNKRKHVLDQETELAIAAIDYELEEGLISQQDYGLRLKGILAKRHSDQELLEIEHQKNIEAIRIDSIKRAEADFQAELEVLKLQYEYNLDMQEEIVDREYQLKLKSVDYELLTNNQKLLIDEQYTKSKQKLSEIRIAQQEKELNAVATALGAMSNVIGQETAVGKGFAVAQALINTWVAASQALRDPTMPSTIGRFALAAAAIATGLNTVRNILKVNPKSGGASVSGSSSVISAPQAPRSFASPVGMNLLTRPQMTQTQLNAAPQQSFPMAELITAIKSMPPPVVTVEDINARTIQKNKVEVRGNI